ncbi:hypothetical protein [Mycoplasma struthionis]|uniref:Uncharacterized protein n=1 Tax=Mycoplasma struthionis TaxID=538220 RepID=A0A502M1L5_9MOLU|nr:hypothetical protein [Mycoplasma struthionis]TPI01549.1 hypothetical protein FJM01_02180 [Mycoplasma struthionis]
MYKLKNNFYEVEAVEKFNGNVFPIYIDKKEYQFFSKHDFQTFIKKTKSNIETIIEGQISEIVLLSQKNGDFPIFKEYKKSENNLNYKNLTKLIQNDYSKRDLIVTNIDFSHSKEKEKIATVEYLNKKDYISLKNIFESQNLKIAKILDFDSINALNAFKNESKFLNLLINLENNTIKFSLIKNTDIIKTKEFKLNINNYENVLVLLAKNIQNKNYLTNFFEKLSDDLYKFLKEFNLNLSNLNLGFNKEFNFLFNDLKKYSGFSVAKEITINDSKNLISEEFLGLNHLLTSVQESSSELSLTNELFIIDTYTFKNDYNLIN